jgi:uncharacterized protein (TIGR00730 family)
MPLEQLCVYAPAADGARAEFQVAAYDFGQEMARRGIGLVYGGARVGLMGILAEAALEGGGWVAGVIPGEEGASLSKLAHQGLSELVIAGSMHERKAEMARRADAFVALPGGLGTFEEILEAATWTQLGVHTKACGLLNLGGYFDPLLGQLDAAVAEKFLAPRHRDMVLAEEDPGTLLATLATWEAPEPKYGQGHRRSGSSPLASGAA